MYETDSKNISSRLGFQLGTTWSRPLCASSDGQMGWMIVQVRIAYTETDAVGKKTDLNTAGAWMSAYEKQKGKWVMTAVTSTFGQD
jgi:hypothetical protein